MRLKNADCITLKNALAVVENAGRDDLSAALREMLERFKKSQAETRNANRVRAARRRAAEREKA